MVSLSDLSGSISGKFLTIGLIVLLVCGNAAFLLTAVLPRWQTYNQLASQVAAGQEAVEQREDDSTASDALSVLQAQIAGAEEKRAAAARTLLTSDQADSLIDHLYSYASTYDVQITNFQAQQAALTTENSVYDVRRFRVQMQGDLQRQMNMISGMAEITAPAVVLNEIAAAPDKSGTTLTMNIVIYTSPYAPDDPLPASAPTDSAVPVSQPVTGAPVQILTPSPPDAAVGGAPVLPVVDCPGAQASPFYPGDTVVVDFNSVGALKILKRPSDMEALTQVYDGTYLRLLDGPVCGTWHREKILYWHVDSDGIQGWAGEGDSQDRWMCPLTEPECAS